MIPALRARFNASWTEARYQAMLAHLQAQTNAAIEFPVSETPCFFSRPLIDRLADVGRDLIQQCSNGDAGAAAERAVPDRFRGAAASEPHPTFIQVDFGLIRTPGGEIEPKLVELQAFPSLYGFQMALVEAYCEAFEMPEGLERCLGGLTTAALRPLLQAALTGDHDPSEVVLMEIEPQRQKTRPDFVITERLWGVRAVDTAEIVKQGRRLFYRRAGRLTPIRRIYNRVIPDELERKAVRLPFDYRDDLDVEWAGHPEWYFRISKFSIPWLRHESVPRTWFLHDVTELPLSREDVILKPLYSFAGGGIVFAPTEAQLAAIPAASRDQFILQERITFEPVVDTPHGPTQAEIRLMYVWIDRLRAVLPLVRMGRGRMMGVDHNKGLRWVGASAGLIASQGASGASGASGA
ncbi:MAG TPA: hypothetical protein VMO26_02395 [Vicinamibacterales bacterium]|nr:hypothetical protein [Vicinamibacterales bacterium]